MSTAKNGKKSRSSVSKSENRLSDNQPSRTPKNRSNTPETISRIVIEDDQSSGNSRVTQQHDVSRVDPRGKPSTAPTLVEQCDDDIDPSSPAATTLSPLPNWDLNQASQKPDDFKKALAKLEAEESMGLLTAYAEQARKACIDQSTGLVNDQTLDNWAGTLTKLFKTALPALALPDIRRLLKKTSGTQPSLQGPMNPQELGIFSRGNRLYIQKGGEKSKPSIVANFVPTDIRSGTLRYLNGTSTDVHVVTIEGKKDPVEVHGSLFSPKSWNSADANKYFVNSPNVLRQYLDYQINVRNILRRDPTLDRVYWVGSYRGQDNKITWTDEVKFPHREEECPYHGLAMPDSQNNDAIRLISQLYKDKAAAMWLTWILGTAFKPAYNNTYPHMAVIGKKESGKTTAANAIRERFGFQLYGANSQFTTSYRTKKSLSNTNLPVIIDEVQRLQPKAESMFMEALNSAYNLSPSTHGAHGMYFTLGAPAMMLGQDWVLRDVALNAKTVILHLDKNQKDPTALESLSKCPEQAPIRKWMKFACDYANDNDLMAAVQKKVELLKVKLAKSLSDHTDESERTLFNYATLLVAEEAIEKFGLKLDVTDFIVDRAGKHVTGDGIDSGYAQQTIGQQFLWDLASELQTYNGRGAVPYLCDKNGLHFNLSVAQRYLQSRGKRYDVRSDKALGNELKDAGARYDADNRRTLGGIQMRCVTVPYKVLMEMGIDMSGLSQNTYEPTVSNLISQDTSKTAK